ncbi:MAG: ABC transporter substrate-binding protein [Halanaerobiales bacterium]
MKKGFLLIVVFISLLIFLTACGTQEESQDLSLRIGLMPAVDSAPVVLAEEKGYFEELGLEVDIQIYRNANNRQSALQSGELDGTMTDLIAFVNNVQNGFDVKITTSTDGSFPFLLKQDFQEKDEIKIGMMKVSVSNFLSEQFLGDKYEMDKQYIPAIPTRLEMIVAGKMDMAIIPEPMASMGQLRGLEKRVYENEDDYMPEAMVFTDTALKEKAEAIRLFHQAYNKAVRDIQEDDSQARDVLISRLELNPDIKDMIVMPQYHLARVPDPEYMKKIVKWIEEIQGIEIDVEYSDMISKEFLE